MIHKTCIIDSKAKISKTAKIGPYTIIGSNVEIEDEVVYIHTSILQVIQKLEPEPRSFHLQVLVLNPKI